MTHWINRLLSPLGVTLKKKSSLDALQAILWDAQQQNTTLVRQMEEQVQLNEQCQQRNTAPVSYTHLTLPTILLV